MQLYEGLRGLLCHQTKRIKKSLSRGKKGDQGQKKINFLNAIMNFICVKRNFNIANNEAYNFTHLKRQNATQIAV